MRFALAIVATLAALAAICPAAGAEDFRIETRVYSVKEKTLLSQNTTLFRDGVVYDFLGDPPQIAVFDKLHGRFVLLDTQRKLRSDISTEQLLVFCGELRAWALNASKGYLQFCGKPQFAIEFTEKSSELSLTSPFMTYKLQTTKAKSLDASHQMREFSDWYARLNALTNPGGILPFPRLAVNEELDRRGLVAEQVELNIVPQAQLGGKSVSVRSEHEVQWQLLDRDMKRIADTDTQLVSFRKAEFSEFMRQPPESTH